MGILYMNEKTIHGGGSTVQKRGLYKKSVLENINSSLDIDVFNLLIRNFAKRVRATLFLLSFYVALYVV